MHYETVQLEENQDGDLVLPLSDAVLNAVGWSTGDSIKWTDNGDGTFLLTKAAPTTVLVRVDTVRLVRHTYYVEAPVTHPEYALDTVTCGQATMCSKQFLDETIVSHRVVDAAEFNKDDGVIYGVQQS